jgi:hypothetical protein
MLTALWQVTAMHFYLLAYPKTKPSLIGIHSNYDVSLSPMPTHNVLVGAASGATGTLSKATPAEEQLQQLHLTVKTARSFPTS